MMPDCDIWSKINASADDVIASLGCDLAINGADEVHNPEHINLDLHRVLDGVVVQWPGLRDMLHRDDGLRLIFVDNMQSIVVQLRTMYEETCSATKPGSSGIATRKALFDLVRRDFVAFANRAAQCIISKASCADAERDAGNPTKILTDAYSHSAYPAPAERDRLARACGMTSKQVTTWVRTDLFHKSASANLHLTVRKCTTARPDTSRVEAKETSETL